MKPGGKQMPLDADPVPGGNIAVDWDTETGVMDKVAWNFPRQGVDPPRYRSHFASCPDANQWRI
jgi:hypothetical protein